MSETYKGGSVPPDLPVRVRKLLEDHDRALTRGVAKETVIVNLIGGGRSPGGGSQPAVAFQVSNVTGTVNRIPPQAAGTMVAFRFPNLPTIKDQTGNIILASGDMEILSKNEILVLSSDGTNWYEISRSRSGALTGIFVPAALWGATPHATADRTAQIQAAFDNCPLHAILLFQAGTYNISNTLVLDRNINVYAYSVTFDLGTSTPTTPTFSPGVPENYNGGYLSIAAREAGTLTNLAGLIWGLDTAVEADRIQQSYIAGLNITRTAADNSAASRLYCGILMLATFQDQLRDVHITNFREGLVLLGGNGRGCTGNTIQDLWVTNCRYAVTYYSNRATSGSVNENSFIGGRVQINTAIQSFPWTPEEWEFIRLLWQSGGTSPAAPNNNLFIRLNLEGGTAAPGRKVRCEGTDNRFLQCRYENLHAAGTPDITLGEVSRANSSFSGNMFDGGQFLRDIINRGNIEFLSSGGGNGVNNANAFIAGTSWASARVDSAGATETTAHRLQTASSTGAILGLCSNLNTERFRFFHDDADAGLLESLHMLDTSEVFKARIARSSDATFGGLCLIPEANGSGFKAVNVFGTNDATGLSIFDDNTDIYLRTGLPRGFLVNVTAGQYARLQQNFSTYIGIDPSGEAGSNVPFSASIDRNSDTVGKAIAVVARRTGGVNPAAGFGAEMQFNLMSDDGSPALPEVFVIAGRWQTFWDTSTTASVDSSMKFIVRDNAVEKEVMRIYGALPGIRIENSTSIGTPNALLDVRGDAIFNEDGAAVNFRVESDTNANMLFVDGTNNVVGIGQTGLAGTTLAVLGPTLIHSTTNAKFTVQEDTNGAKLDIQCPTAANDIRLDFDYGAGVTHRIEADSATGNLLINPRVIGTGIVNIQGKVLVDTEVEIDGALNHDGTTVGFYGATPVTQQTYTITNVTTDRSYDANATTIDELADTLGTLIADLRSVGLVL